MYLMNAWYAALWAQDLPVGQPRPLTLLEEPVVFTRNEQGRVAAMQDRCPHRFVPLSRGTCLPGGGIRCIYHGLEFDNTGSCVHNPHGSGKVPSGTRVRTFPVVERHDMIWIWIWMGQAPADETNVPDYSFLEGGENILLSAREEILVRAGHELIVEKLLDLSHVSFLHDGLLASPATVLAQIRLEEGEGQLTVRRSMAGIPSTQLFDTLYAEKGRTIDMWFDIAWHAASALMNDVGATDPGADRSLGYRVRGAHILTPETATTTHYRFAAALRVPVEHDHTRNPLLGKQLSEIRRFAFEEQDAPLIEAQHRETMRAGPNVPKHVLFEVDAGPVRYRRMLEKLLDQEATAR